MPNKFPISNFQFPINFQFFNLRIRKFVTKWRLETGDRKLGSGFTLIELLVVISIIGILATLVSANLNSARGRARDAARKSDIRNITTALRLYYNDKNSYPVGTYFDSLWGLPWTDTGITYMSKLPADPLSNQTYKYEVSEDRNSYTLSACLENSSDAQGISAAASPYDVWCPTSKWMFQIKQ